MYHLFYLIHHHKKKKKSGDEDEIFSKVFVKFIWRWPCIPSSTQANNSLWVTDFLRKVVDNGTRAFRRELEEEVHRGKISWRI